MSADPNKKLDTYFMNFVADPNFSSFMNGFFGQDKIWVKNALRAVLPDSISDEVLTNAATSLLNYKNQNSLIYRQPKPTHVDDFFRDFYDK
jgi:hypothetical protein